MTSARIASFTLVILNLAGAVWFLVSFEETLHCAESTSFRVAVLDMEPDSEEVTEHGGPLSAFAYPTAVPIRAAGAVLTLGVLFVAPVTLLAVLVGRLRRRMAVLWALSTWVVAIITAQLAAPVLGLRLGILVAAATFVSILLSPAFAYGLALTLPGPEKIRSRR